MSPAEYKQMLSTGKVIESASGTTHVARPANINAYGKQAANGSLYVTFDVPSKSLIDTQKGWAKIVGPNTLEARLAAKKGLPVPQMPEATNITKCAVKENGTIKTFQYRSITPNNSSSKSSGIRGGGGSFSRKGFKGIQSPLDNIIN